jgi:hypothetical protein
MSSMRRAFATSDDRLLTHLQAPPDLSEGIRSLTYWMSGDGGCPGTAFARAERPCG